MDMAMQHYSVFHFGLDMGAGFYPLDKVQDGSIKLAEDGSMPKRKFATRPVESQEVQKRENYETSSPAKLSAFGATSRCRLNDMALVRSGTNGANIKFGICVRHKSHHPWLRNFKIHRKLHKAIGEKYGREEYFLGRMEFSDILAVHLVIYGPLGRGISSCRLLDALAKDFADHIREKSIEAPSKFSEDVQMIRQERSTIVDVNGPQLKV